MLYIIYIVIRYAIAVSMYTLYMYILYMYVYIYIYIYICMCIYILCTGVMMQCKHWATSLRCAGHTQITTLWNNLKSSHKNTYSGAVNVLRLMVNIGNTKTSTLTAKNVCNFIEWLLHKSEDIVYFIYSINDLIL